MTKRAPFPFIPKPGTVQFGESQIRIVIEVDSNGLMRTSVNKPLPAVQVLGLLLDSMQGQYQAMARQASLLINPEGSPVNPEEPKPNGRETQENDNSRGGTPSES